MGEEAAIELDERWCALEDRIALEEALDEADQRELAEIPLDDLRAAECELFEELANAGRPGPETALGAEDEALIERVVAATAESANDPSLVERKRSVRLPVALGALLATAAGLALVFGIGREGVSSDAVRVETGRAWAAAGQALDPGDPLPRAHWVDVDEGSCLRGGRGRVCAAQARGRLRLDDTDGTVALSEGSFELDGSWSVQAGEVGIEPSEFPVSLRVEVSGARVSVIVDAGEVNITGEFERVIRGAGTRFEWPEVAPEPAPPDVVAVPPPTGTETAGSAEPAPEPPTEATSDDTSADAGARKPARAKAPATETADAMLRSARALAAGGSMRKSSAAYEQLIEAHPKSEEAKNARVTLGQLYLRTNRPKLARAAFRDYLDHSKGALEEEARWGEVQAFHRMGESERRDEAIASLEAAFPRSVYLSRAHKLARQ